MATLDGLAQQHRLSQLEHLHEQQNTDQSCPQLDYSPVFVFLHISIHLPSYKERDDNYLNYFTLTSNTKKNRELQTEWRILSAGFFFGLRYPNEKSI